MNITELIPQIDALFVPWDKTCSPGCALAVIHEGEIIYKRGYGNGQPGVWRADHTADGLPDWLHFPNSLLPWAIALLAHEGKISWMMMSVLYITGTAGFWRYDHHPAPGAPHHGLRGIDELNCPAGDRLDDVDPGTGYSWVSCATAPQFEFQTR